MQWAGRGSMPAERRRLGDGMHSSFIWPCFQDMSPSCEDMFVHVDDINVFAETCLRYMIIWKNRKTCIFSQTIRLCISILWVYSRTLMQKSPGIGRASFQAKYWPFPWYAASVHFSWAICTIGIIGPKVVTCLAVNGAEALVDCSRPPLDLCFWSKTL